MDCGRIQCFLLATVSGHVIYERFFAKFTDIEKAALRAALQRTYESIADRAADEAEFAGRYK